MKEEANQMPVPMSPSGRHGTSLTSRLKMRFIVMIGLLLGLCGCATRSDAEKSLSGAYTQMVPGCTSELTLFDSGGFIWHDSGWHPSEGVWEKERARGTWSADASGVHLTCSDLSVPRQLQVILTRTGERMLVGKASFRAHEATFEWMFFSGDRESFKSLPDRPTQKKDILSVER